MFKVIDGPDTGKTRKLLKECVDNKGVFICKHPERVPEKCFAYGINCEGLTTGTYNDLADYLECDTNDYYKKVVYVDDLDLLLQAIQTTCDFKIGGYGLTVEE